MLLRFALAVSIVCSFSVGLLAESGSQSNGSNSAASTPSGRTKKSASQVKANTKSTTRRTSSGSTKAVRSKAALPAAANPADELKTYRMVRASQVEPVSEFNGDVRDLPQMPVRQHPELELIEPADYVHSNVALKTPTALVAPPLGPMPALSAYLPGMSYLDNYCVGSQCGNGHPPDTNGDVGLNHYIQAINMQER